LTLREACSTSPPAKPASARPAQSVLQLASSILIACEGLLACRCRPPRLLQALRTRQGLRQARRFGQGRPPPVRRLSPPAGHAELAMQVLRRVRQPHRPVSAVFPFLRTPSSESSAPDAAPEIVRHSSSFDCILRRVADRHQGWHPRDRPEEGSEAHHRDLREGSASMFCSNSAHARMQTSSPASTRPSTTSTRACPRRFLSRRSRCKDRNYALQRRALATRPSTNHRVAGRGF
jgi:hypothetical protein